MKILFRILLIIIIVHFIACTKNSDNSTSASATSLVKTASFNSAIFESYTVNYLYNSNKEVISAVTAPGDSILYEYNGNVITSRDFRNGILQTTNMYYLASTGLVDTATENNGTTSFKAIYSSDRYLKTMTSYSNSTVPDAIYTYTIENGNTIFYLQTNGNGGGTGSQTNTFDMTKLNSIGNENTGQPYRGKSSKNLPTHVVDFAPSNTLEFDYTYTYDSQGRVKTITILENTVTYGVTTFEYY